MDYTLSLMRSFWEAGVSYWDLAEQGNHNEDKIYSYLKFFKGFQISGTHSLTPYIKGANYTETGKSTNNGNALFAGVYHTWTVDEALTINSSANIVRNWRVFQMRDSTISSFSSCFSWRLSKSITLSLPSITIYLPLEEGDQETEFVIGVGPRIEW